MADDADRRKRKAVDRGNELLDLLDELKAGLLTGRVAEANLKNLKNAVAGGNLDTGDRDLEDLIKQIDLRVRVELAKLAKATG